MLHILLLFICLMLLCCFIILLQHHYYFCCFFLHRSKSLDSSVYRNSKGRQSSSNLPLPRHRSRSSSCRNKQQQQKSLRKRRSDFYTSRHNSLEAINEAKRALNFALRAYELEAKAELSLPTLCSERLTQPSSRVLLSMIGALSHSEGRQAKIRRTIYRMLLSKTEVIVS